MMSIRSVILALSMTTAAVAQRDDTPVAPPEIQNDRKVETIGDAPTEGELERAAELMGYEEEVRRIKARHFGSIRNTARRKAGFDELATFTDPAAFRSMWRVLRDEKDDVRLWLLDYFAQNAEDGQGALAWIAINEVGDNEVADENKYEALRRLTSPPGQPVLNALDYGLRHHDANVANAAASVAGAVNAIEAIPLMIFAQAAGDDADGDPPGDEAWILVGTQTVYVQALIPIVNNGAVAFQPIPGVLTEGFVFRVVDSAVIIYRTIIHRVLVTMTTNDWGQPTDHLGYDVNAWVDWYNDEYLPYKNAQMKVAELAGDG